MPFPAGAVGPVVGPSALTQTPRPGSSGPRGWLAPGLLNALVRDPSTSSGDAIGSTSGGVRHYERAQDRPDRGWARGDLVSPDAVGPGALVVAGRVFHAFVPEPDGIAHHVHAALPRRRTDDGHTLDPNTWGRRDTVAPGHAVAAALVDGELVLAVASDDGVNVGRVAQGRWVADLSIGGASRPALAARWGSVALLVEQDGGLHLWEKKGRWGVRAGAAATWHDTPLPLTASASAGLVADADGWLVAAPRGDVLETWEIHDGEATRRATLTWGAGRIDGIALLPDRRGTLHALTSEEGSVYQHRRHAGAWLRVNCLRLHDTAPFAVEEHESTKLAQVTGEVDSQPRREGGGRPTLSRSDSTAGVLGTDLGVRVSHGGQDYLLFGDTHWRGRPWLTTRDSIARIEPEGPVPGLPGFTFHGAPLRVAGGGVTMREYDVPLDGFSVGDDFYAFFTSNHFRRGQVMGRSVLARASGLRADPRARVRPVTFRTVGTFSERHFINVSVQPFPAADVPGFGVEGDVLLVFGAGSYRAGDLRLAVLDPREGADLRSVRYWAGPDAAGAPLWSPREADARPLLHPGAFGEISVRWVPEVGRFLLLSCSGPEDPIGLAVTLRTAEHAWGPWSPRRRLLDWVARGMWFDDPYSRFIKALASGTDLVGDRIFRGQADATGAAYAPYFFDATPDATPDAPPDATRDGGDLVLRYCLSTWNPYQVVLMQHRLGPDVFRTAHPGSGSPDHG